MHSFEVHSNESACRKSGHLGLEQVIWAFEFSCFLIGLDRLIFISQTRWTYHGLNIGRDIQQDWGFDRKISGYVLKSIAYGSQISVSTLLDMIFVVAVFDWYSLLVWKIFYWLIMGKSIRLKNFRSTWQIISQIFWLQKIDNNLFYIMFG